MAAAYMKHIASNFVKLNKFEGVEFKRWQKKDALLAFQHGYGNVESFKELWDSLEAKYMAEDASSKKFLVSNFTNYKMTYSRPVLEQYNELLGILERAVVRLPDPKLKTLGERGIECIFVGYAEHSKAFRFYVIEPNESVSINSIIESRDVIFDENRFSSVPIVIDVPLLLDHEFDFFAAEPVPGLAEAPNNQNRWIE
ncbi:hypothetical protein Tco_0221493 [Tanacetum coccineum]